MDRDALRPHALDGALLLFRPSTGESARIVAAETAGLRRQAPRVVLFSLSHACNLQCGFCSRDVDNRARWDVDEAQELLVALSEAGTLEVAFGGGEPLAYRGLLELLAGVHARTPLAMHITTNGELVDAALARALAPWVGEVRVSVYEGGAWRRAIAHLRAAGVRVGANILLRPESAAVLPALVAEVEALGANDLALLRYVGAGRERALTASDWMTLESVARTANIPVRLSRCFADRMPTLPRAPTLTDCGAGRDFVVIDPDRQLRACSFHDVRRPFRDAAELLAIYQREAAVFGGSAPGGGCARAAGAAGDASPAAVDEVVLQRAFASNNSGDTVLVARFRDATEPEALVRDFAGLSDRGQALRALAEREGVDPTLAHWDATVRCSGRTLLASGYDAYDALALLRAVVTRRGARVVTSAVHDHGHVGLLVGAEVSEPSLTAVRAGLWAAGAQEVERHGGLVYALFAAPEGRAAIPWEEALVRVAEAVPSARVRAELLTSDTARGLLDGCKKPLKATEPGYFQAFFHSDADARAFLERTGEGGGVARVGSTVLWQVERFRARLAQRADQAGAVGCWLPPGPTRVRAHFWGAGKDVTPSAVRGALSRTLATSPNPGFETPTLQKAYRSVSLEASAAAPLSLLPVLVEVATRLGLSVGASVAPARPLAHAMARVRYELEVVPP